MQSIKQNFKGTTNTEEENPRPYLYQTDVSSLANIHFDKRILLVKGNEIYLDTAKPPNLAQCGKSLVKMEMMQLNTRIVRRNWPVGSNLLSLEGAGKWTPAELLEDQAWEHSDLIRHKKQYCAGEIWW